MLIPLVQCPKLCCPISSLRFHSRQSPGILRPRRGRAGAEASPPALPLTASWLLRLHQGRSTLGKVLGEMKISTAKKQVLQSIAGAFPCNAVLHKWFKVPSAACVLCGHPAETQSHIQCLCPALKEARIRAHHNMAQRLWKGIKDSTKGWTTLRPGELIQGKTSSGQGLVFFKPL